jgi:putative ABC transport system ATP-binding protein
MNISLHLSKVQKTFKNGGEPVHVLREISLSINAGENFFIVGPSGCGKTTLLSVLCGTLKADAGDIELLGQKLNHMSDTEITKFRAHHIGFVFQQFNLIPTLTVAENVAIPLRLAGNSAAKAKSAAIDMLASVGLENKHAQYPFSLSGGQQQRVAIARALVHQPQIIVCDEPTSALDSQTGARVIELITNRSSSKLRTVITVTHDPRIYHYADRIAEMEDGQIQKVHLAAEGSDSERFGSLVTTQNKGKS